MSTLSFLQAVQLCDEALDFCLQWRPYLLEAMIEARHLRGGPWQFQLKQDKPDGAIHGNAVPVGDVLYATIHDDAPDVPFRAFGLVGPSGRCPRIGSVAQKLVARIGHLMDEHRKAIHCLRVLLPQVESRAPEAVDTAPLVRVIQWLKRMKAPYVPVNNHQVPLTVGGIPKTPICISLRKRSATERRSIVEHQEEALRAGKVTLYLLAKQLRQRQAPTPSMNEFRCQGQEWVVRFRGNTAPVPKLKGITYIWHLLCRPGKALSALELTALVSAKPQHTGLGDRGAAVMDNRAWAEARDTFERLQKELQGARVANDAAAEQRVRREMADLSRVMERAQGKGAIARRLGDRAERARKAVCKAIELALVKIRGSDRDLWHHLDTSIMRGFLLSYDPPERLEWSL